MSKMSKIQCMQCNALNGMHVEDIEDIKIHVLFVICSYLYSSQRLLNLVAEGWAKFEKVCKEVGAGELPQLLQYVKTHTTPTPTPTPIPTLVKQEMKEEQEQEPMDVGAVKSEVIIEKPRHISLGGKQ